jgi:stress-induced morphogen
MDLKEKVESALRNRIHCDQVELVDYDSISGFVVSADFRGLSSTDRHELIDRALRDPSVKLSRSERRRVLLIAPLPPVEYELVAPNGTGGRRRSRRCIPGLKEKVENALRRCVPIEHIYLEDDDGIFGFVVSPDFQGMPGIDRQTLIYQALRDPAAKLSKSELRHIVLILPRSPMEFEAADREEGLYSRYWSSIASP